MRQKLLFAALAASLALLSGYALSKVKADKAEDMTGKAAYHKISAEEAYEMMASQEVVVVDVRTCLLYTSQQPYPAQKEKYAGAFCHGQAKGKGEYGHGNACHGEKGVLHIQSFAHFFSTPDIFSSLAILMPINAPSADTATTAIVIPTAASGALSATAASGPVSYTHLDVYKRQGNGYERTKEFLGQKCRSVRPLYAKGSGGV